MQMNVAHTRSMLLDGKETEYQLQDQLESCDILLVETGGMSIEQRRDLNKPNRLSQDCSLHLSY